MPSVFRRAALAAALLAVALPAQAGGPCSTDAEAEAMRGRLMQTEFMVATLSCTQVGRRELRDHYNDFVKRYAGELARNAKVLRGYFQRHYGAAAGRNFDTYVTEIANQAAQRSMAGTDYCERMVGHIRAAIESKERKLVPVSAMLGYGDLPAFAPRCTLTARRPEK